MDTSTIRDIELPEHYSLWGDGSYRDNRRSPVTRAWFAVTITTECVNVTRRLTACEMTMKRTWEGVVINYTDPYGKDREEEARTFPAETLNVTVIQAQEPGFAPGDYITDHTGTGRILGACLGDDGLWRYRVQETGMWTHPGDEHVVPEWKITTPPALREKPGREENTAPRGTEG